MSRCSVKMMSLRGQPFASVASALSCEDRATARSTCGRSRRRGRARAVSTRSASSSELGVELLDGLGGGGGVEQLLLELLDLLGVELVVVESSPEVDAGLASSR